jgi:hypothetical protein
MDQYAYDQWIVDLAERACKKAPFMPRALPPAFRYHSCGERYARIEWDMLKEVDPQDGGEVEINGELVHYWLEVRICACGAQITHEWNTSDAPLEVSGLLMRMLKR